MSDHVCPWWIGYLLASPLRRLVSDPVRLLGPHLRPGMRAMDIGPGMGFFSLPMARMVGAEGRVICVDLQRRMLASLERRARSKGLADRIETLLCPSPEDLGLARLSGSVDFALACAVIHEVPDAGAALCQILGALTPRGRLLFLEPKGHVSDERFEAAVATAQDVGFRLVERLSVWRNHAILLERPASAA
jgi:ubiquinone/menaquinone biosynthesis C-methylase UbiE